MKIKTWLKLLLVSFIQVPLAMVGILLFILNPKQDIIEIKRAVDKIFDTIFNLDHWSKGK